MGVEHIWRKSSDLRDFLKRDKKVVQFKEVPSLRGHQGRTGTDQDNGSVCL